MRRLPAVAVLGAIAVQVPSPVAWAQTQDRYGPVQPASAATEASTPVAMLSWPGKAVASVRPAPQTIAPPAVAPPQSAAPQAALPASIYAPPAQPALDRPFKLRGVILDDAAAPAPSPPSATIPPLPASTAPQVAAPAPPQALAPAPMAAASPATQPLGDGVVHSAAAPRIYSVAREYGLKPDPDPLPAQFFADTQGSDLATPPPPLDPHPVAGTQASTSSLNSADNRARQTALATADAGADGPAGGAGASPN